MSYEACLEAYLGVDGVCPKPHLGLYGGDGVCPKPILGSSGAEMGYVPSPILGLSGVDMGYVPNPSLGLSGVEMGYVPNPFWVCYMQNLVSPNHLSKVYLNFEERHTSILTWCITRIALGYTFNIWCIPQRQVFEAILIPS